MTPTTRLACGACGRTGHFSIRRVTGPDGDRRFVCDDCARRIEDVAIGGLPSQMATQLEPHAAARGIATDALAGRIITTVLRDKLIDAVLDDGDERAAA